MFSDFNNVVYLVLALVAILLPTILQFLFGTGAGFWLDFASNAGIYVLLALGLNVVVGFAGLLDLGYAAFFAIGAYTYGMLASSDLATSPLHHAVHIPFWILLFIALGVAATAGVILGAPTLRLRGDYLAIVTLGFGEIVPDVFRNLSQFTGGVNGIAPVDPPAIPLWLDGPWAGVNFAVSHNFLFGFDPVPYYVLVVLLIGLTVILILNLRRSRIGRAWMAIREDEVAAAAMGVNPVTTKLLAFSIGASFSGFAGCIFAAKLADVTPDNFGFIISVTILVMVVLGGMGNPAGVIIGAAVIYFVQNLAVPSLLPGWATSLASSIGFSSLNQPNGDWAGLGPMIGRLNFLIFGLILVLVMVLRPQGLLPNRLRQAELTKGTSDTELYDTRQA